MSLRGGQTPEAQGAREAHSPLSEGSYGASSIEILTDLEAVRRRPAMYIGSTSQDGLHQMVFEVVENAIDEALAGFCSHIEVDLDSGGNCTVTDNGRGIPVDPHPLTGRPASEVVLTTLHAGGKFGGRAYGVSGGLHGVGVSCVNALSETLSLTVWREGGEYVQEFGRGVPRGDLNRVGETSRRGTRLRFRPDPLIFGAEPLFDPPSLARRLEEHAFLHPGLSLSLVHPSSGPGLTWRYQTGVAGFVSSRNRERQVLHPQPIRVQGQMDGIEVDAAFQWTTSYDEALSTYVNSIATPQGGTHLEGLQAALTRVVHRHASRHPGGDQGGGTSIAGYDIREGLTAVLSVRMADPEFGGQTKSTLTSQRAGAPVQAILERGLEEAFAADPSLASAVVGRALEASRARWAARRAGERARYQGVDSRISAQVYQRQFGIRSRDWHQSAKWITDETLLSAHASLCAVEPSARVLDVCCGSGVVGAAFRGRVGSITGLDLTAEMRALASQRLDEVVAGDVYNIPFADGTFDLAVNREVLHLLPRPERPVAEIFRVLKPGGQFVVGQLLPYGPVDAPWMFRILKKKQPLFFNNFLEEDFRSLLEGAGFQGIHSIEVIQWEDIDRWIDTHETSPLHRHEIRELYHHAPAAVRAAHPFQISSQGGILDGWRWCVFSARKPL